MPAENGLTDSAPLLVAVEDENGNDGDDLGDSFVLAVAYGGQHDVCGGSEQAQAGDGEFARDDDDDHPGSNPIQLDKRDEGRANHDFVRQRVHQDAEVCDEFPATGDLAVQKIADAAGDKQREGNGPMEGNLRKHDCQTSDGESE